MRALLLSAAFLVGCGHKNGESLCKGDNPPPECMTACDPLAPNTCPAGFYCNSGHCDAECTPNGGQCESTYHCSPDGRCVLNGSDVDANCPAAHFTPTKVTPSIELVLDRSGSMTTNFGGVTRFQAMVDGLFGATGAVTTTQGQVYFGEALFAGDQMPCLSLAGFTAPRMLNNATAMQTLTTNHAPNGGSTPTAPAIDQTVADFMTNKPPMGSPPVILLATDGEPNSCAGGGGTGPSITAGQAAYAAGVRLFIVGLAGLNAQFLQDMANVGVGKAPGQAPGCAACAPYYVANDPTSLANAFSSIINGVLSCDLMITGGTVDPATACNGTVTLNGAPLTCGTDWVVDANGTTIHLLGAACDTLKATTNPMVEATFPCGSVIF